MSKRKKSRQEHLKERLDQRALSNSKTEILFKTTPWRQWMIWLKGSGLK